MIRKILSFARKHSLLSRFATSGTSRPFDMMIIIGMLYGANAVRGYDWKDVWIGTWLMAAITFFVVAEFSGVYRSYRDEELVSRITRLCSSWLFTAAILLFVAFATKTTEQFSRITSLLWVGMSAVCLSAWHVVVGIILRRIRVKGHNSRRAAIVGVNDLSVSLARSIDSRPWMGVEIVGHFEARHKDRVPDPVSELGPFLGGYDQLVELARCGEVDMIYISLPMRAENRINELIELLGTTTASIYLSHSFVGFNLLPPNYAPRWNNIGGVSVLGIVESPFHGMLGWIKQMEDKILGFVFLTVSLLPMLLIAIAIRLTSRGPIFFRQTRYGLNEQPIDVLKFRTMTVCENDSIQQVTQNDSRVTRLGAFLRRTSLDELPQFFHVMTGKMSIVGPRPHAVAHNEQYRRMLNFYMVRHKVKPGITGWAQVNGWRGETDTDEKMQKRLEYDLVYIRNWSLLFDLRIIFLTVFGSKVRVNAY